MPQGRTNSSAKIDQRLEEFHDFVVIRETEMAWLVLLRDSCRPEQLWFPKAITVYNGGGVFYVRRWAAVEKGLI